MAKAPSIPTDTISGLTSTGGKILQDIKAIAAQGRGTSNGNFGMSLSIGIMNKGTGGYVRKSIYNVDKSMLLRFDVTRDFLTSFTDYMVVEFQIPARAYKEVILKNKSSLMAFLKFGILDHNAHIVGSNQKFIDESVNYWRLSAYVLESEGYNASDPYADNVKDDELDKIGLVRCKLQLVFPEYEILNSWCVGITLKDADMYNTVAVMLAKFMKDREPKLFGSPMEFNCRFEPPDNEVKQENIVTTDFIKDPGKNDASVPTLLNMIYNVHEMYGMYVSGMCLYVYRELNGHKKTFKTIKSGNDSEGVDAVKEAEAAEKELKETSLAICRGIRPVPVPLPYPVDYIDGEGKGVIGEPKNVNVMYDKVKAIGGKMIRVFVSPPDPSIAVTENTFGCLANDFDPSGKERSKTANLALFSLDIISTSRPVIVNPTHEFIGNFADEAYFPAKGNYKRLTENSEGGGIRMDTKDDNKSKVSLSQQELFSDADKDKEEERKKAQEKADKQRQKEMNKMSAAERVRNNVVLDDSEKLEEAKKDGIGSLITAASQALSTYWGRVQKYFVSSSANQFKETSENYMLSTVKMSLEWRHGNPWLINPNDLTEVLIEDKKGLFHYLGSITSVAWTYDFARKSANGKIQFMGKLSHITPPPVTPNPSKKEGSGGGSDKGPVITGSKTATGGSNSRSRTRTPSIPLVRDIDMF